MGAFYGSIHVRGVSHSAVRAAAEAVAREQQAKCLIGPPADDRWVVIYPEGNGQDYRFGQSLAERTRGVVVHVLVHDSDVFAYWIWRDGRLADSHNSWPDYFEDEGAPEESAPVGDANFLAELSGRSSVEFSNVLARHSKSDGVSPDFAEERLAEFARLMGLGDADSAYEYLIGEDRKRRSRRLEELPADEVAQAAEDGHARRTRINAQVKRLTKSQALLVNEVTKGFAGSGAVGVAGNVFFRGIDGQGQTCPVERFEKGAPMTRLVFEAQNRPSHIVSDSTGSVIVLAGWNGIEIRRADTWERVMAAPESAGTTSVALSADGRRLAFASRYEVVVTDIASGQTVATIHGTASQLAWHPSGDWLVGGYGSLGFARVGLASRPAWRRLCPGGRAPFDPVMDVARVSFADVDLQEFERRKRAEIEACLGRMRKSSTEELRETRESLEASLEAELAEARRAVRDRTEPMHRGNESASRVGFSRDGCLLFVGTDKGLRVYRWPDVESAVSASGADMPCPMYRVDLSHLTIPASSTSTNTTSVGYVYAIAEEPGGTGLFFPDYHGTLYRMDLKTGEVRELGRLPEGGPVVWAGLTADGRMLGVQSRTGGDQSPGKEKWIWQIWDYDMLRNGALKAT